MQFIKIKYEDFKVEGYRMYNINGHFIPIRLWEDFLQVLEDGEFYLISDRKKHLDDLGGTYGRSSLNNLINLVEGDRYCRNFNKISKGYYEKKLS